MADLERSLLALVDPPLADPPPVDDLRRRARALRQRRRAGRSAGAVAALALVVAGVAVTRGPAPRETVRAVAPATGVTTAPGPAAGALPLQPDARAATVLRSFPTATGEWQLVVGPGDGGLCFGARESDTFSSLECIDPAAGPLQLRAMGLFNQSFIYGTIAEDATQVSSTIGPLDLLGTDAGFPVNFLGAIVPEGVNEVRVTAGTAESPGKYAGLVIVHGRVSTINGQRAPGVTTTAAPRPTPTATTPPTTVAPPTTAPPVTSPPPTAPPSPGGSPKRIEVTPGAVDPRPQTFESAFAAGARSVAVRFWSGVEPCMALAGVEVVETASTVTITVWTGTAPGGELMVCTLQAVYYETIVALDAPLGDRTIVDGAA